MIKLLDIALKDFSRAFRSAFALIFMFGVPILVTVMFYIMFGGSSEGEPAFSLPQMKVIIVNQDAGGAGGFQSFGEMLTSSLQSPGMADLFAVTLSDSVEDARAAVDSQQAGAAILIPKEFSAALLEPGRAAAIELYHDPTLTLGPAIAKGILSQFVQSFASGAGSVNRILEQLSENGVAVDAALAQEAGLQLGAAYTKLGSAAMVEARAPAGAAASQPANPLAEMLGLIMGGMMVFYAFFTTTNSLQAILVEEENGTLPRLFTTPTTVFQILGGKFLATLLIVLVQIIVLLLFAYFVFAIDWGAPLPLTLSVVGTVLASTTFALFIISLLNSTKQSGIVFGGVLTIMGMIGIFSVFTQNAPGAASFTETIALFVPQGWAMRSLRLAMDGAGLDSALGVFAGLLVWSAAFFTIAVLRFQKRYA